MENSFEDQLKQWELISSNPSQAQIDVVATWIKQNQINADELVLNAAKRVFTNLHWLVTEYKKARDNYVRLSQSTLTAGSNELFIEQLNLLHQIAEHREELEEDLELVGDLLSEIGVEFDPSQNTLVAHEVVAEMPTHSSTEMNVSTNSWSSDTAGIVPQHPTVEATPVNNPLVNEVSVSTSAEVQPEVSKPVESIEEIHLAGAEGNHQMNSEPMVEVPVEENSTQPEVQQVVELTPTEPKPADLSTLNLDLPLGNQLRQIAEGMEGDANENYYQLLKQALANDDYRSKLRARAQKVVDNESGNETFEQINAARDILRSIEQVEVNPGAPLEVYAIASHFLS